MPGPNNEKCANCYYWEFLEGDKGKCLINAPKPIIGEIGKTYQVVLPIKLKDEWCGEFELRILPEFDETNEKSSYTMDKYPKKDE